MRIHHSFCLSTVAYGALHARFTLLRKHTDNGVTSILSPSVGGDILSMWQYTQDRTYSSAAESRCQTQTTRAHTRTRVHRTVC